MMVLHNARERTEEDFAQILARADQRLKLRKVWRRGPDTAASTIIDLNDTEVLLRLRERSSSFSLFTPPEHIKSIDTFS